MNRGCVHPPSTLQQVTKSKSNFVQVTKVTWTKCSIPGEDTKSAVLVASYILSLSLSFIVCVSLSLSLSLCLSLTLSLSLSHSLHFSPSPVVILSRVVRGNHSSNVSESHTLCLFPHCTLLCEHLRLTLRCPFYSHQ